jgi:hypothetical protein
MVAAPAKAQYSKPTLTIFGEFANLTAAGVGSTPEAASSSRNKQRA